MSLKTIRSRPIVCALFCLLLCHLTATTAQPRFEDVTPDAIPFRLFDADGMSVGDYNNDGWPDLFMAEFINDIYDGGDRIALLYNGGRGSFVRDAALLPDDLLHFDSRAINGETFGAAVFGDYDRDGDLDLYLPLGGYWLHRRNKNVLLRNDHGVFTDVTTQAGLTQELSSAAAIWLDYDRDGYLDLYVADDDQTLADPLRGLLEDHNPSSYHRLYRNNQNGSFTDATAAAGLDVPVGGGENNIAAPDINDDGWPDLHIAIHEGSNRVFLNDGQGQFPDAISSELSNVGVSGIAIGDIDNDGDLDLFQANSGPGGGDFLLSRPVMMLNLGDGQLLDVTEAVGVDFNDLPVQNATFADLDNDGDLDLVTGRPLFLFVNDGEGFFTDATESSGLPAVGGIGMLPVDYDRDGCLDLVYSNILTVFDNEFGGVFRNTCNEHHYLRVELVGGASNRDGIGARISARSGTLRQTRELLGGTARWQRDTVAHFGLGTYTVVDTLEVRWPSGQIDVHTSLPVDQQIRLFEGEPGYHVVVPTTWEHALPDTITLGEAVEIAARALPALFSPQAQIDKVTANLSSWGGAEEVPLEVQPDGSYVLPAQTWIASGLPGRHEVAVLIEQSSPSGPMWTRLVHPIQVIPRDLPSEPLSVYQDDLAPGWELEAFVDHADLRLPDYESDGRAVFELRSTHQVFRGNAALAVQVDSLATPEGPEFEVFRLHFRPPEPVGQQYRGMKFAFHSGSAQCVGFPLISLFLNGRHVVSLATNPWFTPFTRFLLDESIREWQVVEVPLDYPGLEGPIESIEITGWLQGTFYLDEIELLPRPRSPSVTAVQESRESALPAAFSLQQNYPNPFNSGTVIRFELPEAGKTELAVYNLVGQKVTKLVDGMRDAGSYTVRWAGRDANGRDLASGVYLYRLRAEGGHTETRKLLLLR